MEGPHIAVPFLIFISAGNEQKGICEHIHLTLHRWSAGDWLEIREKCQYNEVISIDVVIAAEKENI